MKSSKSPKAWQFNEMSDTMRGSLIYVGTVDGHLNFGLRRKKDWVGSKRANRVKVPKLYPVPVLSSTTILAGPEGSLL